MMSGSEYQLTLTQSDISHILVGLASYLRQFTAHRALDGEASHPESEWQTLRREVGELMWRLEEVLAPPGANIDHSAEAVRPTDG